MGEGILTHTQLITATLRERILKNHINNWHKIFSITWLFEECPLDEVKDIPKISKREHQETPIVFRYEVVLHKGYLFEEAQQVEKVDSDRIELEKGYSLNIPSVMST